MILFISLIFCFLISMGAFHYSYLMAAHSGTKGLYLLVSIPKEFQKEEELGQLLKEYQKSLKKAGLVMLTVGLALAGSLLIPSLTHYILIFMLLCYASFLVPMYVYAHLMQHYRQKLLALKLEKGWRLPVKESIRYADLMTSRLKNRRTPRHALFILPALASLAIFFAFPDANPGNMLLILLISNLIIHGLFFGVHYLISHAPAKIYTEDSQTNLALNQEYRRWWSITYLALSFSQTLLLFLMAFFYLRFAESGGQMQGYFFGMILGMSLLPIVIVFLAYVKIRAKEKELLEQANSSIISGEEDGYYEFHGIYSFQYNNPDNPALMVEKPVGIGTTLNIGNPKGRRIFVVTKLVLYTILIACFFIAGFEDFLAPVMQVEKNELRIARTLYPIELNAESIESIRLTEESFQDGSLYKVVGSATNYYLRGNFSRRGEKIRLYLFQESIPYLVFQLKNTEDEQLYFNYQDSGQTLALWQRLKENFPAELFIKGDKPAEEATEESATLTKEAANAAVEQQTEAITDFSEKRKAVVAAEIDYSIPAGEGSLHAVLNLPEKAEGKVPAILFIGGSGPSTKEGMADIYLDAATCLLDKGIACVRYDKRGIARSASVIDAGKHEDKMVIEDLVSDAAALLKKMKGDEHFSRVYVLGHSEGALVGTLAMQQEAADGMICLAGAGRNIAEITLEQISANPNNPAELIESSRKILAELENGRTTDDVPPLLQALFRRSVQPYMISWIKYDPAEELAKLGEIKILILQGTNDSQVQVVDAERLHQAAPESRLVILPQMTHMLKNSEVAKEQLYQDAVAAQKYLKVYQDNSLPINEELIREIAEFTGE